MPIYQVRIRYPNGSEVNARVTRARLLDLRLADIRGASILVQKVST
jgi:hypothetical protein